MNKRLIGAFVVALLAVFGLAGTATAGDYDDHGWHKRPFFKYVAAAPDSAGNLVVRFKEAGLKPYQRVNVKAEALATVKYACVKDDWHGDKGGKHSKVVVKKSYDWVSAWTGKQHADKYGTFRSALTLAHPSVSCDYGKAVIIKVKWSNLFLKDYCTGAKAFVYGPWKFWATLPSQEDDCGCRLGERIAA